MLKVRLMGTKKDIKWFRTLLLRNPAINVTGFSEVYSSKGTSRFFRHYIEVEPTTAVTITLGKNKEQ